MTKKKTLLYITDFLAPYRVDWINELSKYFNIKCLYFEKKQATREDKWTNSRKPIFEAEYITKRRRFGIATSPECFKAVKNSNFDYYLIDGYGSYIQYWLIKWLAKNKKKIFVNVDGIDLWNKKTLSKVKQLIKKRIYSSGALFICGSRLAADYIASNGARQDKVFVHPLSSIFKEDIIDASQKEELQRTAKKELMKDEKTIVLAVGRFIPLKHYEDLLAAWKNIPNDYYLYLIGSGPLKEKYLEIINKSNLSNVEIIDHLSQEELKKYYIAADVLVHPSETETWGLIINEAMSNGCPCISTNHCVAGVELIEDGLNGYVIEVSDLNAISSKIIECTADHKTWKELSTNSITKIKKYTIESLAESDYKIISNN